MNGEKVLKVIDLYEKKLEHLLKGSFKDNNKLEHAYDMCETIREFVKFHRMPKAFRWLGFVQGILWCEGVYSIEEMKNHNRPTKSEVRAEYPGHTLENNIPCSECDDSTGCKKANKLQEAL